jgi:hypothetical protein
VDRDWFQHHLDQVISSTASLAKRAKTGFKTAELPKPSDRTTAIRHNRTIPDLSDPTNRVRWQKVEAAKRHLVYSLINLDLPLPTIASGGSEPSMSTAMSV